MHHRRFNADVRPLLFWKASHRLSLCAVRPRIRSPQRPEALYSKVRVGYGAASFSGEAPQITGPAPMLLVWRIVQPARNNANLLHSTVFQTASVKDAPRGLPQESSGKIAHRSPQRNELTRASYLRTPSPENRKGSGNLFESPPL
jgi:hypothetical protein